MRPTDSSENHDAVESDGGHADADELTDPEKPEEENKRANDKRDERIGELLEDVQHD